MYPLTQKPYSANRHSHRALPTLADQAGGYEKCDIIFLSCFLRVMCRPEITIMQIIVVIRKNISKKAKRLMSMFYSQRIENFSCEWCEWFFIRIIRIIRKDPPLAARIEIAKV